MKAQSSLHIFKEVNTFFFTFNSGHFTEQGDCLSFNYVSIEAINIDEAITTFKLALSKSIISSNNNYWDNVYNEVEFLQLERRMILQPHLQITKKPHRINDSIKQKRTT